MRSILALLSLTAASPACTFSKPEANSTTGTGTGETEQSGTMNGSSSTDGTTDSSTQTAVTDESATETTETTELETESTMGTETTDTAGTDTSDTTGPRCPDVCGLDGLSCDEACELSFADVPQWYCTGACSPVGEMVGFLNCDQSDADLFCQPLTGDPASTATEWQQV